MMSWVVSMPIGKHGVSTVLEYGTFEAQPGENRQDRSPQINRFEPGLANTKPIK